MCSKPAIFFALSCAFHIALIAYFQWDKQKPAAPIKPNKALVHTIYLKEERPKKIAAAPKTNPTPQSVPKKTNPAIAKVAKKVDTPKVVKAAEPQKVAPAISRAYAEEIAMQLKLLLSLPEYGTVQVSLVLSSTGEVTQVEILDSQSAANEKYLLSTLPKLKMPPPPNGETPLKLTLSNA